MKRSFLWVIMLVFTACQPSPSEVPTVIVILVERLGFAELSCSKAAASQRYGGLAQLCDESVRFTHAYAPSTQSQATIASILTGLYPYQHKVRHNGPQGLSMELKTMPEYLRTIGVKTAFFSGGPPVFRKSGLNQGFDIFDDFYQVTEAHLFRNSRRISDLFLNWMNDEVRQNPAFGVLFWPDLQFTSVPITDSLGELRESSYESQLSEIDESLGYIISNLKKRKRWDNSYIIFAGLNGDPAKFRNYELPPMNLYSESVRVALMIKPARKLRDGAFNWQVDANVTLTDLAPTISKIYRFELPQPDDVFPTVALNSVLLQPAPDWNADRYVVSESGWGAWHKISGHRAAVRTGPYLYFFDDRERFYNTLADNQEVAPFTMKDDRFQNLALRARTKLESVGYRSWYVNDSTTALKFQLGRNVWKRLPANSDSKSKADRRFDFRKQLLDVQSSNPKQTWPGSWYVAQSIRLGSPIEKDIMKAKFWPLPYKGLFGIGPVGKTDCRSLGRLRNQPSTVVDKDCLSPLIILFRNYFQQQANFDRKPMGLDDFRRRLDQENVRHLIAAEGYATGGMWDVHYQLLDSLDPGYLFFDIPDVKKDLRQRGLTSWLSK